MDLLLIRDRMAFPPPSFVAYFVKLGEVEELISPHPFTPYQIIDQSISLPFTTLSPPTHQPSHFPRIHPPNPPSLNQSFHSKRREGRRQSKINTPQTSANQPRARDASARPSMQRKSPKRGQQFTSLKSNQPSPPIEHFASNERQLVRWS